MAPEYNGCHRGTSEQRQNALVSRDEGSAILPLFEPAANRLDLTAGLLCNPALFSQTLLWAATDDPLVIRQAAGECLRRVH